jgi:hypothetical protein
VLLDSYAVRSLSGMIVTLLAMMMVQGYAMDVNGGALRG